MPTDPVAPPPKEPPLAVAPFLATVDATVDQGVPGLAPPPWSPPTFPHLVDTLGAVLPGDYDKTVAYILSVAATWSYSDPKSLADAMIPVGWTNRASADLCGAVATRTFENDAMLVKTTVSFLQAGKVGILCFRGTEPTNILQWLSNVGSVMEPFYTSGKAHSGFYRSLTPALDFILGALTAATNGDFASIDTPIQPFGRGIQQNPGRFPFAIPRIHRTPPPAPLPPMEALYITGHSLGAALAVLTAAVIHQDPLYAGFRGPLRGVYTFGTPRIGDQVFCGTCQKQFGELVFRHVYNRDVVPHLPSKDLGYYQTFGEERVSTDTGWSGFQATYVSQAPSLFLAVGSAALDWGAQQVFGFSRYRLPYSIADHMPNNYMACSAKPFPELLVQG